MFYVRGGGRILVCTLKWEEEGVEVRIWKKGIGGVESLQCVVNQKKKKEENKCPYIYKRSRIQGLDLPLGPQGYFPRFRRLILYTNTLYSTFFPLWRSFLRY
jgi:hypothetical protein